MSRRLEDRGIQFMLKSLNDEVRLIGRNAGEIDEMQARST